LKKGAALEAAKRTIGHFPDQPLFEEIWGLSLPVIPAEAGIQAVNIGPVRGHDRDPNEDILAKACRLSYPDDWRGVAQSDRVMKG
jgi:hypothetical protein